MRRARARAGVVVVLATGVILSACGSDDRSSAGSSTTSSRSGSASSIAPADGHVATTTPPASEGGRPSSEQAGRATPSTLKGGGYAPTPAGTYRFKLEGKAASASFGEQPIDGESTLEVEAPAGSDQRSTQSAQGASTTQVLRFGADGVRLVSIKSSQQGVTKEFRPEPPASVLPYPLKQGQKWTWSSTSTDGKTKITASFTFDREEQLTIAGERVPTWVILARLVTSGDVTSTSDQTIWYAEPLRMIAKQHDVTDGKFGAISFHSDTTRTLLSTKPT